VLRNVKQGWTPGDRRKYFLALRQTNDYLAGQGMPGFLQKIREEAVASLTEQEKRELEPLLVPERSPTETGPAEERKLVRKWTVDDLVGDLPKVSDARDVNRGRKMFAAVSCNRCHRVGVDGTLVGPDLTSASRRFSRRDLLESILAPSKVIPDNYRSVRIETRDGKIYEGRVIPSGDYRSPTIRLATNPQSPHEFIEFTKSEIELQTPSPISWMPEGLLDTLTKDEILDLLAFLEAGGSP
jgi:putative heme-binding domain-containing protein